MQSFFFSWTTPSEASAVMQNESEWMIEGQELAELLRGPL